MRMLRSMLVGATTLVLAVGSVSAPSMDATPAVAAASPSAEAIVGNVLWESMGGPPGAGRVVQLMQTTGPDHALYAVAAPTVFSSSDGGDTWSSIDALEDVWVSSLAARGDEVIVCGQAIYRLDAAGAHSWFPEACDAIGADDDTVVAARSSGSAATVKVWQADETGAWQDVTPPASLLDGLVLPGEGTPWHIGVGPVIPVADGILAGFRVAAGGSGGLDNGGLYRRDNASAAWSQIEWPAPDGTVLHRLFRDPRHPERVVATFSDPSLQEVRHPISSLAFESSDEGRTWRPITDSMVASNAVTDVVDVNGARYLASPFDGYMLRLKGSKTEVVPMPEVEGIPGAVVGLETILVDPEKPRIIYGMPGSPWEYGLVRSTDRMKTWHKMDSTIIASAPTIVVSHPHDPAVVMTSGNVIQESYATRDGGETWSPFSPTTSGDELRIDPHDTDHIIVIDEMTGIYESHDGGLSFDPLATEFSGAKVLDFEVAPDVPGLVYASILGVGISYPGLDGWEHMSGSPDYAYDIELDPDDSRVLYATDSPKKFEDHASVWRYRPEQAEDFGWSEILRVEDAAGITSLRFDPADSDTLYAGVTGPTGSVWVSHDRGESWAQLNPALTFTSVQGHSQLEVVPGDEDADTVLAGTWGGGSFRSVDSGDTWMELDDEHTFSPTCIEAAPANPDIVYACDRTAPLIHRSTDGGTTWEEFFDFGPGHLTTTALAVDPGDPDLVYAAAFRPPTAMLGSLYRIRDGVMEADLGGGLPRAVLDIAVDEEAPSRLYATTHLHGLFASDDAGISWRRLDDQGTGLPRTGYLDVDVDPHDSDTLYAASLCGRIPAYVIDPVRSALGEGMALRNIDPGAACGLYRSSDRGRTWELLLETVGEAKAVEASAARPGSLYVADSSAGVWASDDGGSSWRQENAGLATTSVAAIAAGADRVYAGTQGSGVSVGTLSADGGISWDGSRSPRVYVYRTQIEVDPGDPERLYASAYPGGVLRSDDGGRTWSSKNFLTPSIRVDDPTVQGYYAMDIDPADPDTVWLGVYGVGLILSRDGREFGTFANGQDGKLRGAHITSVEVDPRDGKRVFVGAEEGVFVTADAGKTWRRLNKGLGSKDIRSVKLSAAASAPFAADFKGRDDGGFRLEPGWRVSGGKLVGTGHTWANAGSPDWTDYSFESKVKLDGGSIHVNARVNDEGRYFVGLSPDVLTLSKTSDGWQKHRLIKEVPAAIGTKPHRVRIAVDGPRVRVFIDGVKMIDHRDRQPHLQGGIAFENLEDKKVTVDRVRVKFAAAPTQAYVGTAGYGLYRLGASDERWRHMDRPLGFGWWSPWERRMYQFSSLLFDPRKEDVIYYGHFPGGFFVSEDGGGSWRDSSVGLGNDGMFSLAQHPDDQDTLFAGTYNGIVTSTDGGATWADSSEGIPPEQWPYTVAVDSDDPEVMYTSTKNGQNMGFCDRNADSFCGVVMKSTDGGRTWTRIMSGLDPMSEFYTLLIYPPNHDTLLLSTSRGVFVSLDAGERWWPMSEGLPSTDNWVRDNVADNLTLSPDDRYLLLGLVKHGVWRADLEPLREAVS